MQRSQGRDERFTDYVGRRSAQLSATAYLLCSDRHRADDLLQIALTKLYLAWDRAERAESIDAYVRQILVRVSIDESRRPWRRHESSTAEPRSDSASSPPDTDADPAVIAELRRLAPQQRAAVVLRFWHDLSVEDTAALLDCSTSTVKTHTARGLERLRAALTAPALPHGGDHG